MKLVRYGAAGREKPGVVDREGHIRDLSDVVADIAGETLSPKSLAKLAQAQARQAAAGPRHSAARSLRRQGRQLPRHRPQLCRPRRRGRAGGAAGRSSSTSRRLHLRPADDTMLPKGSAKLDYEVELGVVIGSRARYLRRAPPWMRLPAIAWPTTSPSASSSSSARGQWIKGKRCETFGPIGP